jgi:hypothetical protein
MNLVFFHPSHTPSQGQQRLLLAGVVSFLFSFQFFTRLAAMLSVEAAISIALITLPKQLKAALERTCS